MVKNLWARFCFSAITFSVFLAHYNLPAALYTGNGSGSGGGAIGNGNLSMSDHGGTIFATLTKGTTGNFNDVLVLFIDTHSGSGFTSTSSFSDTTPDLRRAISGLINTDNRSTANFAAGFKAEYALAITFQGGVIYKLRSGNDLSPGLIRNVSVSPNDAGNHGSYAFNFDWTDIGLTSGGGFSFESSYITGTGSRYLESFESTSGAGGFGNTITFGNYDNYGVPPLPEPVNTALAVFGGIAVVSGTVSRARRLSRKGVPFSPF